MLISMLISISINIFMLILTSIKLINKINGLISCLVSLNGTGALEFINSQQYVYGENVRVTLRPYF